MRMWRAIPANDDATGNPMCGWGGGGADSNRLPVQASLRREDELQ